MADVLGSEGEGSDGERSVPMDKVVMLIWQFRDDPTVVTFMARFVAKVRSLVRSSTVSRKLVGFCSVRFPFDSFRFSSLSSTLLDY